MFKIEFVATPTASDSPPLHSELALTKSIEEAKDLANSHLSAAKDKYGANGYRIWDESHHRVVIGPKDDREA